MGGDPGTRTVSDMSKQQFLKLFGAEILRVALNVKILTSVRFCPCGHEVFSSYSAGKTKIFRIGTLIEPFFSEKKNRFGRTTGRTGAADKEGGPRMPPLL